MENGGLCVMITGTTMMQESCVASWGSQGDVSVDYIVVPLINICMCLRHKAYPFSLVNSYTNITSCSSSCSRGGYMYVFF